MLWGDYRWHTRFRGRILKRRVWKKHMRRMRRQVQSDARKAEQRRNPCGLPYEYHWPKDGRWYLTVDRMGYSRAVLEP